MEIGPIFRAITRNTARFLLTVGMTALTLAIIVNCIQMIVVERAKLAQPSGFVDEELLYVNFDLLGEQYGDETVVAEQRREDLRFFRSHPGVVSATNTYMKPWRGGGSSSEWAPAGVEDDGAFVRAQMYPAGPHLASTLGSEFIGEPIDEAMMEVNFMDPSASEPFGVVISRKLADLLFPGEDPRGKMIRSKFAPHLKPVVAGVLEEFYQPYAWEIHEYVVFYPGYVGNEFWGQPYLVRVKPELLDDIAGFEAELLALAPGRNVSIEKIPEVRKEFHATSFALVRLLGLVIILMVTVTGLGIVGMTSFSITQRKRQIGTRRALGATQGAILRYFLTENGIVTALGVGLGLIGAGGLNMALVLGFDAQRLEAPFVIAGVLVVVVGNQLAALVPAIRGSRVAPAMATRAI